jgi:uncharacterized protein YodC (DUF2158 family)
MWRLKNVSQAVNLKRDYVFKHDDGRVLKLEHWASIEAVFYRVSDLTQLRRGTPAMIDAVYACRAYIELGGDADAFVVEELF